MIKIYNRKTKQYETELVSGESTIKWLYSSNTGKSFLNLIFKKKFASSIIGAFSDMNLSRVKIKKFVDNFNIDLSQSIKSIDEFKNFNDFFTRKLHEDARPIDKDVNSLISPGDGRIFAYENISMDNIIQVKGFTYSLSELIKNDEIAKKYEGGTCIVLRLCPTDYHRFHFIDSGIPSDITKINGHYYSVSPYALNKIAKLYCENKREWSILKSDNFDEVLSIEVGATAVGSIIQTFISNKKVCKGEEKGYFKFGGSTTILFLKKDVAKIDTDILQQTNQGFETLVAMGGKIGTKVF